MELFQQEFILPLKNGLEIKLKMKLSVALTVLLSMLEMVSIQQMGFSLFRSQEHTGIPKLLCLWADFQNSFLPEICNDVECLEL